MPHLSFSHMSWLFLQASNRPTMFFSVPSSAHMSVTLIAISLHDECLTKSLWCWEWWRSVFLCDEVVRIALEGEPDRDAVDIGGKAGTRDLWIGDSLSTQNIFTVDTLILWNHFRVLYVWLCLIYTTLHHTFVLSTRYTRTLNHQSTCWRLQCYTAG